MSYGEPAPVVRLFVSYAHNDSFWMQSLLPLLRFDGVQVKPWTDKDIRTGVRWDEEIKRELNEMHVFIPLVSVHFAVSKYINEVECEIARKRLENREIEVVPIYVAFPGEDELEWLMRLQRVPPGDKSWAETYREFKEHDLALAPIRDGIKKVVERARRRVCGGV